MVGGTWAALLGYLASAMLSPALMRFTASASVWLVVGLCAGLVLATPGSAGETVSATPGGIAPSFGG